MSKNHINHNNDDEIIDVKPFLNLINSIFRSIFSSFISVIKFYKRKATLFTVLIIVGVVGGYFLGKILHTDKIFKQEIILQPKYGVENYMYNFLGTLKSSLKDSIFLDEINLSKDEVHNLKKVVLEPVIEATDVLDGLHKKYGDKDFFRYIIDDYNDQKLKNVKYRSFYKFHKLTLYFKTNSPDNDKITKALLAYISSNEYYNELLSLKLKQTQSGLEKNKKTLVFVEEYLNKLNNNVANDKKEIVVFAKESDIPTVSSLLERKDELLYVINKQEKIMTLEKKLFNIVQYDNVVSENVATHKRLLVVIPVILCICASILFLFIYTLKKLTASN